MAKVSFLPLSERQSDHSTQHEMKVNVVWHCVVLAPQPYLSHREAKLSPVLHQRGSELVRSSDPAATA